MIEIFSVCIGALIAMVATSINNKFILSREEKHEKIREKMKEIDTLILLNKKINEILVKRDLNLDFYQSFDSFDDVYITIDDYVYLQSFCAQNHFYLPSFLVEEFFKEFNHRQAIYNPDDVIRLGGHTYKGAKMVLENFSEQLLRCAEDRKAELQQLKK
ncbi:hypothetical protein [Vagococcus acidifermentans]|uniref:Uncharacterized protein n=1 Tax=Vagococcus acidifermentans TaxID=564710 RepID=A0A430AS32_9ENTE|nr:hypothetical protein [Vagococcus acidifermentans]RSU10863.1 hypothetical protein CBF27_09210 [Vagococcus acidifermentans]